MMSRSVKVEQDKNPMLRKTCIEVDVDSIVVIVLVRDAVLHVRENEFRKILEI